MNKRAVSNCHKSLVYAWSSNFKVCVLSLIKLTLVKLKKPKKSSDLPLLDSCKFYTVQFVILEDNKGERVHLNRK